MKLLAIDHNGMCMFHRHSEYLQKYAKWDDKEGENIELGPTREAAHSL
jgi:hypothetical protein